MDKVNLFDETEIVEEKDKWRYENEELEISVSESEEETSIDEGSFQIDDLDII